MQPPQHGDTGDSSACRSGRFCHVQEPPHRSRYVYILQPWDIAGNPVWSSRPYCGVRPWSRDACLKTCDETGGSGNGTGLAPWSVRLSSFSSFVRDRFLRPNRNGVDDHDGLVPKSPQGGKREENSQHARSTGSVPLPPSRTTAAAPPEPVTPNRHVVGEGSLVPEPSHTQPLPPPVSAAGMGLSDSRERLGS
ncbi:hypothetical protein LY78DRAFT_661280 [Colletotrichum sublineola]|nr:hypothetical protein LY78DRAFT_661280 [Colletotrichum sublineola]